MRKTTGAPWRPGAAKIQAGGRKGPAGPQAVRTFVTFSENFLERLRIFLGAGMAAVLPIGIGGGEV